MRFSSRPAIVALLVICASLACGPFQTYGQAMDVVCRAPVDCEACATGSPADRATLLAAHIDANLWNRDARDVFEALAMVDPESKAELLRQAALEGGVADCPLADFMQAAGSTPPPQ